jgi:hypothetical protein
MTDLGTFEQAERKCAIQNDFYRAVLEIWAIDWERPLPRGMNLYQIND